MSDSKYFCDLSALTSEERGRYAEVAKQLPGQVEAIDELEKGFAFTFPISKENFMLVAEFITYEGSCCPFLSFKLNWTSGETLGRLAVTGEAEAKPFIQAEFSMLQR